jgi:hypothetical protein
MAQKPAWQRYLEGESKQTGLSLNPSSIGVRATPLAPVLAPGTNTELEKIRKQDERAQLAAQSLGVDNTGTQSTGLVSKVLGVGSKGLQALAYPFGVITETARFLVSPAVRIYQEAEQELAKLGNAEQIARREKLFGGATKDDDLETVWNVKEYLNSFKDPRFLSEVEYIAPELEKIRAGRGGKVTAGAVGFIADVLGSGGFGTGAAVAGKLGRTRQAQLVENSAKDAFTKTAKKSADESAEAFEARAVDFSRRAALAQNTGRSGEVAKLFEREFGEQLGKSAFKRLPAEAKGGLRIYIAGDTLASLNAGGYTTRAVADALRIPGLPKATDWGVKSFQNLKNTARAGAFQSPKLNAAVNGVNWALNRVGQSAETWQSFQRAAVSGAGEKQILDAYAGFSDGIAAINNLRNIRMEAVQNTKDLLADISRLKPQKNKLGMVTQVGDQEAYDTATKLMRDTGSIDDFVVETASQAKGLQFAKAYRDEFDRIHKLLTSAGFDVEYADNYLPLLYAKNDKDFAKIAKLLEAGPKNIPGGTYDPTKARTKFMKTVVDSETGVEKVIAMRPDEMREFFLKQGRKDLADMIESDPEVLLARYATNTSRLIANASVVRDMLNKGVLQRASLPQLAVDAPSIEQAIGQLNPTQLTRVTQAFASVEGGLSRYVETINDEFVQAVRLNDPALRAAAEAKVEALVLSLRDSRDILTKRSSDVARKLRAADEAQDVEALAAIRPTLQKLEQERKLLTSEADRLSKLNTPESNQLADDLLRKSNNGMEYLQVGAGIEGAYYLPKEFADLIGERALVETINRRLVLQGGGKEAQRLLGELDKSFDIFMQFWRTSATFGKFFGFVARNVVGAVQNNVLILGSTAADHGVGSYITKSDILTDRALIPFTQLSRADKSSKRLEKLAAKGKLTKDQVDALGKDIEDYGYVRVPTARAIKEQSMQNLLSKKTIDGTDITYYDVYKAAYQGKVYDSYTILPTMQGKSAADDEAVGLMNIDADRVQLATDKIGKDRGALQRIGEGALNIGFDIPADIAGRKIRIEPIPFATVRTTRTANERAEQFARTSAIATGMRKYGKDEGGVKSAILGMKASQFDYSDLTDFERTIMRRVMPFWTWSKNNVPAQVRVLFNDPLRVERNFQLYDAISNMFADDNGNAIVVPDYVTEMSGFLLDEDIRNNLLESENSPAWLKEMLKFPIGVPTAQLSPVTELERLTAGIPLLGTPSAGESFLDNETIRQAASGNPILKAVIQGYFTNKSLYTGREYKDVDAPGWLTGLNDIIGKAAGKENVLGLTIDPKTGAQVVSGNLVDQMRTLMPLMAPFDAQTLGVLDAIIEARTGEESNLSTQLDQKTYTSLLNSLAGISLVSVNPDVEQGTLKNRINAKNDAINSIAGNQKIDTVKLNKLIKGYQAAGYTNEQILYAVEQARKSGQLLPDWAVGN